MPDQRTEEGQHSMTASSPKVCVIGAGAAGLCAARYLKEISWNAHVFELSDVVGGTWVYTEETGHDCLGNAIHSSMYKNLKTNIPKEIMAFPDFPFPEKGNSFLPHEKVRNYLERYCDHFELRDVIKFKHKVMHVEPIEGSSSWIVSVKCLSSGLVRTGTYDAVLVCIGHFSVPSYPNIKNIEQFQGLQIHSHDYRTPRHFKGMVVVVLGAGLSGTDISLEVAAQASKVYLSHNKPTLPSLPDNIAQVSGIIECIGSHGFLLKDGRKLQQVDALLYCTGYEYTFPFLSNKCNLKTENKQVKPLYKHIVHADYSTLGFIGLPVLTIPFILFDRQIQWFLSVLQGSIKLPNSEEMKAEIQLELEFKIKNGIPERHFHVLNDYQWVYYAELASQANIPQLPKRIEDLYNYIDSRREENLTSYKQESYQLVDGKYVPK